MATIITSGIDLHWWSSKKIQNSLASWTAWDLVNFRKSILTSYLCYVMLCYVMLCILYLKSMHKIVYDKKLVNIDWLMLQSLQETKCDALLLLLLLQPTQTKFKQQQLQQQQKTPQFKYENRARASRLHFSEIQ